MIGYLYNHDLGITSCCRILYYHGQSEGQAIRMGWLDRFDLAALDGDCRRIFGGDTRMVVHGISMGAATTMMALGRALTALRQVFCRGLRLYGRLGRVLQGELKSSFGLPAFPLLYTASWLCDLKYGWNFREASSLAQVAKCRLPMPSTAMPTIMSPPGWFACFSRRSRATRSCGSCRCRTCRFLPRQPGGSTRRVGESSVGKYTGPLEKGPGRLPGACRFEYAPLDI